MRCTLITETLPTRTTVVLCVHTPKVLLTCLACLCGYKMQQCRGRQRNHIHHETIYALPQKSTIKGSTHKLHIAQVGFIYCSMRYMQQASACTFLHVVTHINKHTVRKCVRMYANITDRHMYHYLRVWPPVRWCRHVCHPAGDCLCGHGCHTAHHPGYTAHAFNDTPSSVSAVSTHS